MQTTKPVVEPSITKLDREEIVAPPYVSFSTFKKLLDWLRSEGVPLQFDRSFWQAKFSGSTGAQLVAALRFFGLLHGDRPLPDLENLVQSTPDDRRFIIRELLKDSYDAVPFNELDRATPAMVKQWFKLYPIDGHTLRKAISFFVSAVKDAELPMSNAVSKMAKSRSAKPSTSSATRDKQTAQNLLTSMAATGRTKAQVAVQSNQTTIQLESGGEITVGLSLDLFKLADRDRNFVLSLVDMTKKYATHSSTISAIGDESIDDR